MRRAAQLPSCHSRLPTSNLSRPGDLTLQDMIKIHDLTLNVPVGRFCEVADIGTTKFYELVRDGVIRIRKNGRLATVPVEDLFQLLRGDQGAA